MGQTGYGQEGALSPLPGHRARDSEPGAFCSLSVHPSWMSGRGTWHGDCSLTGVRGIHWPSFPRMPGPRGREERNEAGKGQRVRQQRRGYLLSRLCTAQGPLAEGADGKLEFSPYSTGHAACPGSDHICPEERTHFLILTKVPHGLQGPHRSLPQMGKGWDKLRPQFSPSA